MRTILEPLRRGALPGMVLLLAGCAVLQAPDRPAITRHLLESAATTRSADTVATGPSVSVEAPRAAPGYDTDAMRYRRDGGALERFAMNRWADTPARMLHPMLVAALSTTDGLGEVITGPSAARADYTLDVEVVRFRQEFAAQDRSSRVVVVLRAELHASTDGRVLLARDFVAESPDVAPDPVSGAAALQGAVDQVLAELASAVAAVANSG